MSEDWEARALAAEAEVDRLHNRIAVVFAEGQGEKAEAVAAERARIARDLDQAWWAKAKALPTPDVVADGAHPVGYRDGYLDGLEDAARIAEAQP